jgi:hypothetical protein
VPYEQYHLTYLKPACRQTDRTDASVCVSELLPHGLDGCPAVCLRGRLSAHGKVIFLITYKFQSYFRNVTVTIRDLSERRTMQYIKISLSERNVGLLAALPNLSLHITAPGPDNLCRTGI